MLSIQNIVTPFSDEFYRREAIGRNMLLEPIKAPTKDLLSLLDNLEREPSIINTGNRELKRPLNDYKVQKDKLDILINSTFDETDFGNITSILSAVSGIRASLDKFIECTNKIISKLPKTISHKGHKAYVSDLDRSNFEKTLKTHKSISNLLTCIEFGIEINADDNTNYLNLRKKVHTAVKELQNNIQDFAKDLSSEDGNLLNKFSQLFNLIGIEEFFSTGKIYKNTIYDLPSEMTPMNFELIKKLTGLFKDNIPAINCYKEILLKNPSINALGILACKEIIKLKAYDAALEILNLTNNTEENNQDGINDDVLILKLFCYLAQKDVENTYDIIRNVPEELLTKQDNKLLYETQQILRNKVVEEYKNLLVLVNEAHKKAFLEGFINEDTFFTTPAYLRYEARAKDSRDLKEKILLFVKNGLEINATYEGETLLHIATKNKDEVFLIDLLKQSNIDINKTNVLGQTALHIACSSGSVSNRMIKVLLAQQNIDVNIRDKNNNTPLRIIIKSITEPTQPVFDNYQGIYHDEDEYEDGPDISEEEMLIDEHESKQISNCTDLIELFLERELDVNTTYGNGKTLLHYAVEEGNYKLANLLIEYGIDIQIEDDKGQTAKNYTQDENYRNEQIIALFPYNKSANSVIVSSKAENKNELESVDLSKKQEIEKEQSKTNKEGLIVSKDFNSNFEPSISTYDIRILNTYMTISDIKKFKEEKVKGNLTSYIKEYLSSHENDQVKKVEDFYSLLLNASISLKDTDSIQQIFNITKDAGEQFNINSLLTSVDITKHSSISTALYSSKINLINLIENFIQLPHRDVLSKAKLPSYDSKVIDKMKIIMEAPPMHIDYCLEKFLSPIYSDDTIQELVDHITYSESDSESE